jgi:hypothetical protein
VGLPDRPIAVMREYVTEVRGLLAGEQVTAGRIGHGEGVRLAAPGWPRTASLGVADLPPAPVYLAARQAFGTQVLGYALGRPGVPESAGYRGLFAQMGFDAELTELEHRPAGPAARRRDDGGPDAGPHQVRDRVASLSMTPSSWITPKAAKGVDSAIAGRGLVATEAIGKDEVVAVKGGHIVSTTRLRSLSDRLRNSEIQITDDLHLAALADDEYEPVMLFINHSCAPNVGFAGNIVLVAMRDIRPGEELTTDYALFDDYDGSMPCQCGTADCRGVISGHDWQHPDLQRKYRGYFSWYLQRRIQDQ